MAAASSSSSAAKEAAAVLAEPSVAAAAINVSSKKPKPPAKDEMGGFPINSLILAKWRDGSWRAAVLLDKREHCRMLGLPHECVCGRLTRVAVEDTDVSLSAEPIKDGSGEPTGKFNYYVHFDAVSALLPSRTKFGAVSMSAQPNNGIVCRECSCQPVPLCGVSIGNRSSIAAWTVGCTATKPKRIPMLQPGKKRQRPRRRRTFGWRSASAKM